MNTFVGSTSPGLTVSIPSGGSGPGLQDVRITVNAPSALANWNPPQTGLVSYYDPVRGETVTETFPMGGSHGPSALVVRTGSVVDGAYIGEINVHVPQGGIIPNLPPRVFPGAIGEFLKRYGQFNNAIDMVNSSVTVGVSAETTNIIPIDLNANYPPGYLASLGFDPNNLPNGLTGQFDPDGNLIGFENNNHCFKSDTPIQMWPLDPLIKPRADGTYDEQLVLSKVWEKPICEIRVGDLIVSYDDKGRIKPGPVTRTMTNTATHLLDFWNTGVTPGHAYYCADGKFKDQHVPLMDILRTDGAIMRADGTMIRAATNCKVGSMGDMMIHASAAMQKPDGTWTDAKPGKVRFGTRIILPDGKHMSFMEMAASEGWKVTDDGYMVGMMKGEDGTVAERVFHFPYSHGEELPKPEDYILARSKVSLEAIYAAGEWEQIGTRMPAPAGMVGLNTNHTSTLLQLACPHWVVRVDC